MIDIDFLVEQGEKFMKLYNEMSENGKRNFWLAEANAFIIQGMTIEDFQEMIYGMENPYDISYELN